MTPVIAGPRVEKTGASAGAICPICVTSADRIGPSWAAIVATVRKTFPTAS
ncbi:hypothetical protein [Streptomyces sp. Root369]|uniref:hypothetical protein n=1 Tax=Streptomyces sp. Root369 TaxID=1736523 RepID=UPI000A6B138A|nr:hypothetical protein [Streptomyces sp. Root369]